LRADSQQLHRLGYEVDTCPIDFGETAERKIEDVLKAKPYNCVIDRSRHSVDPQQFSAL
jgi:hypothetical protein